jgi:hypothetical protein
VSLEAVAWVKNLPYDACDLGPYRVLLILAEHANSEGKRAWRSKSKIATTLEVSERSVQRWYKALIEARLILPGDQGFVAHIPANRRPVVYDIALGRNVHYQQALMPERVGETRLSTGSLGETTAVGFGETTAVVSRNQELEPTNSSIKRTPSTRAQNETERSAPPPSAAASFAYCPTSPSHQHEKALAGSLSVCGWCGIRDDQWYDQRSGMVRYRSEVTA